LVASYFFYACWDWRFLGLIFLSSLVDYSVGFFLAKTKVKTKRNLLLITSLMVNLGILGFFKYYNFFLESFQDAFSLFGKSLESTNNLLSFFAFVSFFPQLVAGPIERASNLLPQFEKKRLFNYAKSIDGLRLILLGLFKKMVIADNCALAVNDIFTHYTEYN